tara:strand:+ start:747 stop:962 length:216 start_codon:yes stop_codon:yes gene_type:complete
VVVQRSHVPQPSVHTASALRLPSAVVSVLPAAVRHQVARCQWVRSVHSAVSLVTLAARAARARAARAASGK